MNNWYRVVDLERNIFENDTYVQGISPYEVAKSYAKGRGLNENNVKRVYDSKGSNVRLVIYGNGKSFLYSI